MEVLAVLREVDHDARRAQSDSQWKAISTMLEEHRPDVVCLQEVRMPAHCEPGAKPGDGKPRQRGKPNTNTATYRKDAQLLSSLLSKGVFAQYKIYYSLSDKKYSGSALMVRREAAPRQVRYSLDLSSGSPVHNEEGRVIIAEFGGFDVLCTYSPNNGWQEDSFRRRRQWDQQITEFLEQHAQGDKPLIYLGDLNVAPEDIDLSHPEFFRGMKSEKPGMPLPEDPKDRGQPGCTDRERETFFEMLRRGKLVDAFRLQKGGGLEHGDELTEGPHFTWRGNPGKDIPQRGKYFGKGMRIDHTLVSESLYQARVERVEALGHGSFMTGFLGSDHCPVLLVLRESTSPAYF
mmetsp:Transcript_13109/g.36891  ORF Transcript_13109/g.36891 Transcript_13109/m.36891 type:complete len:347 (+) Transcript_13109:660-1700(+)